MSCSYATADHRVAFFFWFARHGRSIPGSSRGKTTLVDAKANLKMEVVNRLDIVQENYSPDM
jgi:hypothetical protein